MVCAAAVMSACGGGGSGGGYDSSTGPGSNGSGNDANDNPAPTTPNTINANPAIAYNPTSLTVSPGSTVTFVFGSVGHSVTFTTAGAPASIPVTSNASVQVVFPTAGVYNFHCTVHPVMNGTITVQ